MKEKLILHLNYLKCKNFKSIELCVLCIKVQDTGMYKLKEKKKKHSYQLTIDASS